jgi:hypothetical protein
VPSQQVTRVRLSCLECCGLMPQPGKKEDTLFGTPAPFEEWVVLIFETILSAYIKGLREQLSNLVHTLKAMDL